MECYSVTIRMNLKGIMLSERRYIHKFICPTIPFIEQCGKSKTIGKESYQWIPRGVRLAIGGNFGDDGEWCGYTVIYIFQNLQSCM